MKNQTYQFRIILIWIICIPLFSSILFSGQDNKIITVRSVTIEGLKRTRASAVRHIVNVKKGDPWTEETRELVERRLKNYGTFRNVSLKERIEGDFVDLSIYLEDRWTLFPVPIVTTGSGSSYGLGLFERNFFGTQKTAGMIALIKEKKPRFALIFSDGYFGAPNMDGIESDIYWIITKKGDPDFRAPHGVGEVIRMN